MCCSIKVMDPSSSIGKTCLGENVINLSSEKTEGHGDWNSLEYHDTTNSGGKKETKAFTFHKIETEEASDRYIAPCFINGLEAYDGEINLGHDENMISNEFDVKLCLDHEFIIDQFLDSSGETEKTDDDWDLLKPLTQEEAAREALAISICERFSILEEERPVIETMAYSDKYKKILDEICVDKMKLDGEIKKEEEESIIKVKGEALLEKEDPRAFRGGKPVNRGITMLNHSKAEPMGFLKDVLCQVGVTTIIVKFLILDMPIDRDTPTLVRIGFLYTSESDSDDEEEYGIQRNSFGAPMYGPKPAKKKAVSFLGSLPVPLKHLDWKSKYTGNYCKKEERDEQWHAEIRLTNPYGNIYLQGVSGFGMGEVVLSTFEELQMLGFFLQMGFTLILATLDGLDVGLLGDVIGEDDCDEDE
ncbi:hypothetical protein Tco_0884398 [Tanacetum coccineum]